MEYHPKKSIFAGKTMPSKKGRTKTIKKDSKNRRIIGMGEQASLYGIKMLPSKIPASAQSSFSILLMTRNIELSGIYLNTFFNIGRLVQKVSGVVLCWALFKNSELPLLLLDR